jgi:hypothetical protein
MLDFLDKCSSFAVNGVKTRNKSLIAFMSSMQLSTKKDVFAFMTISERNPFSSK